MKAAAQTMAVSSQQPSPISNLKALDHETVTLLAGAAQLRTRLVELRRAAAVSEIANQTTDEWLAAYDRTETP